MTIAIIVNVIANTLAVNKTFIIFHPPKKHRGSDAFILQVSSFQTLPEALGYTVLHNTQEY